MRRGKFTSPAALFLPGILTLNMTNVILNEVKNPRNTAVRLLLRGLLRFTRNDVS